jgi:DNA polymerase III subunit beta
VEKFSCIIPIKIAQEIVRTLGNLDDVSNIEVGVGDNQFVVFWETSRIVSRVIDGNFPEYKPIIPKDFGISFSIPQEAILRQVRMANTLTGKLNDIILKTTKNEVLVLSVNPELGTTNSLFSTPIKGGEVSTTLNARYFTDGITSCGGENIFIGINNENSPILLKNPEDNSFLYIIMPIRNTPSY